MAPIWDFFLLAVMLRAHDHTSTSWPSSRAPVHHAHKVRPAAVPSTSGNWSVTTATFNYATTASPRLLSRGHLQPALPDSFAHPRARPLGKRSVASALASYSPL